MLRELLKKNFFRSRMMQQWASTISSNKYIQLPLVGHVRCPCDWISYDFKNVVNNIVFSIVDMVICWMDNLLHYSWGIIFENNILSHLYNVVKLS